MTTSTSGHWEVDTKNGKSYYCMLSGGYALVGARIVDPKEGIQFLENDKCTIEDFSKSSVKNYIKQVSKGFYCLVKIVVRSIIGFQFIDERSF
jgi:hypothetical protein